MIRTAHDSMTLQRAMAEDGRTATRLLRQVELVVQLTTAESRELEMLMLAELWTMRAERGDFGPPERRGAGAITPGRCRHCGCTDTNACRVDDDGTACSWIDPDHTVCSAVRCMHIEHERMMAGEVKR